MWFEVISRLKHNSDKRESNLGEGGFYLKDLARVV